MNHSAIDREFIDACEKASLSQLSDLLEKHPDHDISQIAVDGGKTLLHLLAESNDPEKEKLVQERECQVEVFSPMVALLLYGGCALNDVDHRGLTCLHVAAKRASSSFLTTLIKRGADVTKLSRGKNNVLHIATANPSSAAWAALLASLPNPLIFLRAKNAAGVTPLQLCCILGNPAGVSQCARFLAPISLMPLESRAISPYLKSSSQSTVLLTDILRKKATTELLSVLLKNRSQSDITAMLDTPRITREGESWPNGGSWLHYCCKRSSETSILALIKFGAKSFPDANGFLPLHYCLRRGLLDASIALCRTMIRSDWLLLDKNGRSFLHWICATAAPPPSVNLTHQAVLSPITISWNTFWIHIAHQKPLGEPIQSILSILCKESALGRPDALGNMPIHLLAMRDVNGHATELLCGQLKDEDAWQSTSKKMNVLHLAALNRSHVTMGIFLQKLSLGTLGSDKKAMAAIVNQRDVNGKTPLHHAIRASNPACVQLLLDHGADGSIKDLKGRTALSLAAKIKALLTLVQLVENGVGSFDDVHYELTCAGFPSAIRELESVKICYLELLEQFQQSMQSSPFSSPSYSPVSPRTTRAVSPASLTSPERFPNALNGLNCPGSPTDSESLYAVSLGVPSPSNGMSVHVPNMANNYGLRVPPSSPTKASALGLPRLPISGLGSSPQNAVYDVMSEGERYPLLARRSGSAPAGELSMMPGRNSPRASSAVSRLGENSASNTLGSYSPGGMREAVYPGHFSSSTSSSPIAPYGFTSFSASNSPPSSPTMTRTKPYSTAQSPKPFGDSIVRVSSFDSLQARDLLSGSLNPDSDDLDEFDQFNDRAVPGIGQQVRLRRSGGRDSVPQASSSTDHSNSARHMSLGNANVHSSGSRVPLVPLHFNLEMPPQPPLVISTSGSNLASINSPHRIGSGFTSTSGPASPTGKPPVAMWGGPPSPTAATAPLSPHLSPRSMSPHAGGRTTPPTTPTAAGLDRMKLQRSLSPRSLPTIKEGNNAAAGANKDKEAKEKDKDKDKERTVAKRHRSGSNSSLAKKALMLRSRSLTRLPTNPGEDFLEQLKAENGFPPTPRGYTHHPGSLDQLIPSVLASHSKSHSMDHPAHSISPSASSSNASTATTSSASPPTPLKKRHKSQGKSSHQKTLSASSEPSPSN